MDPIRQSPDWDRPDLEPPEPVVEHKVVRRTHASVARGAFACPACDLPLLPAGRIPITSAVQCPFCLETRPARHYVRAGVRDTGANAVVVQARLPSR